MDSDTEFVDKNKRIFFILYDEYLKTGVSYGSFVKSKDLGIESVSYTFYSDVYKIVDDKKWLLNKIKYGF
jgi:hypothetical protein